MSGCLRHCLRHDNWHDNGCGNGCGHGIKRRGGHLHGWGCRVDPGQALLGLLGHDAVWRDTHSPGVASPGKMRRGQAGQVLGRGLGRCFGDAVSRCRDWPRSDGGPIAQRPLRQRRGAGRAGGRGQRPRKDRRGDIGGGGICPDPRMGAAGTGIPSAGASGAGSTSRAWGACGLPGASGKGKPSDSRIKTTPATSMPQPRPPSRPRPIGPSFAFWGRRTPNTRSRRLSLALDRPRGL